MAMTTKEFLASLLPPADFVRECHMMTERGLEAMEPVSLILTAADQATKDLKDTPVTDPRRLMIAETLGDMQTLVLNPAQQFMEQHALQIDSFRATMTGLVDHFDEPMRMLFMLAAHIRVQYPDNIAVGKTYMMARDALREQNARDPEK